MATVTGVERARRLVTPYLDGGALCAIEEGAFERFPLAPGDEVDAREYLDRLAAFQMKRAYDEALGMLDACDRTEKQVLDRLTRRGFVPGAARAAVERLKENRLIDDAAFARRMVELGAGRPVGRYALQRKLLRKGVAREEAEAALEAVTDDQQRDACAEAARPLLRRYEGQPPRAARAKLGQALYRRGFSWDQIGPVLETLLGEDEMSQ